MDKRWLWTLPSIFFLSLVVNIPAGLIPGLLPQNAPIQGGTWYGSLWHGQVENLLWHQQRLSRLSWTLSPWHLLRLQAQVRFQLQDPAAKAEGIVTFTPNQTQLAATNFDLNASALPDETLHGVKLGGRITGTIESAVIGQSIEKIQVRASWQNALVSTPWTPHPVPLGDLNLSLKPGQDNVPEFFIRSGKPMDLDLKGRWYPPKRIELTGTAAFNLPKEIEPVFRFLTVSTRGDRRTLQYQGSIPGL